MNLIWTFVIVCNFEKSKKSYIHTYKYMYIKTRTIEKIRYNIGYDVGKAEPQDLAVGRGLLFT